MEIGLSFGTNQENRLLHLRSAKDRVLASENVALVAASHIYETEPVDVRPEFADLPFLNSVMIVETALELNVLSDVLHDIEAQMGRVRSSDKNAPRPIDIDVIYADRVIMQTHELTLPHERWSHRRFVVQPLADVRPDLVLPGNHLTVNELLQELPQVPRVRRLDDIW